MTVLFEPILALHIINFSSLQNYWGGGKRYVCPPPPKKKFMGGGRLLPSSPRIDASGGKRLGRARGDVYSGGSRICKKRGGRKKSAPHTGGVQGPAVGPLAGCRGKAPAGAPGGGAPEALEFSANKGLQDGRQE